MDVADNDEKFVSKLHVSSNRSHQIDPNNIPNRMIHQYLQLTQNLIDKKLNDLHTKKAADSVRSNSSKQDMKLVQKLLMDNKITIRPADKNLGICFIDTSWYKEELKLMLSDTITYKRIGINTDTLMMHDIIKTIYDQIQSILVRYQSVISILPAAKQIIKYMKKKVTIKTALLPQIYLLIKVHKKKLCGRPIVPSTKWCTTPASVVLDILLQPTLKCIHWLVKDSKTLVVEIEKNAILAEQRDGLLLTADISSLYTNIDTVLGLQLMRAYLDEQQHIIEPSQSDLIMELLTIVMKSNYLEFNGTVYQQIDGTAMGTPVAPTYANIFMYMLERNVIQNLSNYIYFYRRYLDDVFLCVKPTAETTICSTFNSLHTKLKFEFTSSSEHASFLDLFIYKGNRFQDTGILDLKVHQKSMNLYLYIPFRSFHTTAMKKSFIQTELTRYIRNSSNRADYLALKWKFYDRLRARGYSPRFLDPIFSSIFYDDRQFFLLPVSSWKTSVSHILLPRTVCLRRRMALIMGGVLEVERYTQVRKSNPLVFVLPYDRLSSVLPIRQLLLHYWDLVEAATDQHNRISKPLMAFKSYPSLAKKLILAKNRIQKKRKTIASSVTSDAFNALFKLQIYRNN